MSSRTAITIGNFDGVHVGHAALVRRAREAVGPSGVVLAMTFDPHPMQVLRPGAMRTRLSSLSQRRQWLLEAGASQVIRIEPTREFLAQSPREFVQGLAQTHKPGFIVEGADFRFGKNRQGSVELLRALGTELDFQTLIVDQVEAVLSDCSIVRAGSTMVRWLLDRGRVRDAAILLGRPYEIDATIVPGDKRGRTIGVPTANLDHGEFQLPADGIYFGLAQRENGENFAAAISVGVKPTFGENPRVCEAHLLDYDGPVEEYGWRMRLRFVDWLRDQLTFARVDDLIAQLARDVDQCRGIHESVAQPSRDRTIASAGRLIHG